MLRASTPHITVSRQLGGRRGPLRSRVCHIFTSDHGEEFLEHGGKLHGTTLFEEQVRIPLVFRLPGRLRAGTVVREVVSLVDVMPTLLGLLEVAPPSGMEGVCVMCPDESEGLHGRQVFAEAQTLRASIAGRWKYVFDVADPGGELLFDLIADPRERINLAADEPRRIDILRKSVAHYEATARAQVPPEVAIDRDTLRELEALGYVKVR